MKLIEASKHTWKWRLGTAALAVAAVTGVWQLIRSLRGDFRWDLFLATFLRLDPGWLATSIGLALVTYLGRAVRWRVLIRAQKENPSLWRLFVATSIGFTAIVLFGRPGEMVRPYLIGVKEKLSFSSQMGAWLLERMYDLMMALFIFGFALSQVRSSGLEVGERMNWVLQAGGYFVVGVGAVCMVVFGALRQFGERSKRRILDGLGFLPATYHHKAEELLNAFTQGVQSTRSWGAVVEILFWSITEWLLIVGCYYSLFRASLDLGKFGLMDILIFVGFTAFGSVVQIPGVGGGTQLVTMAVLTELFGVPLEIATGMAVILWAVTFVVIVPLGLLLAFHEGIRWRSLRHLEETIEQPGP